jgi:hypothetical protein
MSLVNGLISVMIAVIIGVGVSVPVCVAVIAGGNLTGTDATLAGFITTLIITSIIVGIVSLM